MLGECAQKNIAFRDSAAASGIGRDYAAQKHRRGALPAVAERMRTNGGAIEQHGAADRIAQSVRKDAADAISDDIERSGHRKGRDRHARRHRLEQDDAERVGQARENKHVGGGIVLSKGLPDLWPSESHLRILRAERFEGRTTADDDFRDGERQIEKRLDSVRAAERARIQAAIQAAGAADQS